MNHAHGVLLMTLVVLSISVRTVYHFKSKVVFDASNHISLSPIVYLSISISPLFLSLQVWLVVPSGIQWAVQEMLQRDNVLHKLFQEREREFQF